MAKSTKLFTLAFKAEHMRRQGNIYNRPLPEIATSLVLDWGVELDKRFSRACQRLNVGEEISDTGTGVLRLEYTITRTK